MTKTVDVAQGQQIASPWGNEIRDRTRQVFASAAERDAQWPTAPNGAQCVTLDTNHVWLRQAGAWRLEPGREIVYGQVTATKAVTAGSEAAADPLVVGTAAVFTAGVPVLIECFAPGVMPALVPSALVVFLLYADGSLLCRMGSVSNPAAGQLIVPVHMVYRFAPSGGSHQFTFAASQTGGTAQVLAGTGGSGTYPPIFLRITST